MSCRCFFATVFLLLAVSTGLAQNWNKQTIDSVRVELEHIYDKDQTFRLQLDSLARLDDDQESPLRRPLIDSVTHYDSINLTKVRYILNKYGWFSEKEVGRKGNLALFSVVQHSDFNIQMQLEPVVKRAVKEKKLKPQHYALFKDRVLLSQGKKQLYGSQVGRMHDTGERYVMPLEDPDNVDKRRKSMGLGTLSDYLKFWNFTWNPTEYKKKNYPNIFNDNIAKAHRASITIDSNFQAEAERNIHFNSDRYFSDFNTHVIAEDYADGKLVDSLNQTRKSVVSWYTYHNDTIGLVVHIGGGINSSALLLKFPRDTILVYYYACGHTEDRKIYKLHKHDKLRQCVEVPPVAYKLFLSGIPDTLAKPIIYGYVDLVSDDYYYHGQSGASVEYRTSMRFYFRSQFGTFDFN